MKSSTPKKTGYCGKQSLKTATNRKVERLKSNGPMLHYSREKAARPFEHDRPLRSARLSNTTIFSNDLFQKTTTNNESRSSHRSCAAGRCASRCAGRGRPVGGAAPCALTGSPGAGPSAGWCRSVPPVPDSSANFCGESFSRRHRPMRNQGLVGPVSNRPEEQNNK